MEIRVRENGQVVQEQEWRALFPNTSFSAELTDAILDEFGADRVYPGERPEVQTPYQVVVPGDVVLGPDDKWLRTFVLGPVFSTPEEEAAHIANIDMRLSMEVRNQRDLMLLQSDWTQVPDSPVDKEAWATYRQALRDITDQPGFPSAVTWPTQP